MSWKLVSRGAVSADYECTECGLTCSFDHGEAMFACDHFTPFSHWHDDDPYDLEDYDFEEKGWGTA